MSSKPGYTYAFIPRVFLQGLFGVYGMDLPAKFTKPDLSTLPANDTIPSNRDSSTISYIGKFMPAPWRSSYLTRALQQKCGTGTPLDSIRPSCLTWLVIKDGCLSRRSSFNSTPFSRLLVASLHIGVYHRRTRGKSGLITMAWFACKSTNLGS